MEENPNFSVRIKNEYNKETNIILFQTIFTRH